MFCHLCRENKTSHGGIMRFMISTRSIITLVIAEESKHYNYYGRKIVIIYEIFHYTNKETTKLECLLHHWIRPSIKSMSFWSKKIYLYNIHAHTRQHWICRCQITHFLCMTYLWTYSACYHWKGFLLTFEYLYLGSSKWIVMLSSWIA